MESKTNYTLVGISVVILIFGLFSASIWLSIGFERKKYNLYTVYVDEAVSGLSDNSVVKYNGVKVGYVHKIELNQIDPQEVKLQIKIEEGTPITISTEATLINQGITGTNYLGLTANSPSPFPLQKTPGEPYPVIPFKHSFLSKLEKNINEVSIGLKRLLDKQNTKNIKKSIQNIETVTQVIAENNTNLNKSLKDIPILLQDLKMAASKFTKMTGNMSIATKQVSSAMQSGKNAADKFSQQTLPPMVIVIHRLESIAANLEKVSSELRQNPSVIIRGTTTPKPGPGE